MRNDARRRGCPISEPSVSPGGGRKGANMLTSPGSAVSASDRLGGAPERVAQRRHDDETRRRAVRRVGKPKRDEAKRRRARRAGYDANDRAGMHVDVSCTKRSV